MKFRISDWHVSLSFLLLTFLLLPNSVAAQSSANGAAASSPAAKPSEGPVLWGKWNTGGIQACSLEYGEPESHAKVRGAGGANKSFIVDPPGQIIPYQSWAIKVRDHRDKMHDDWVNMKSRDLDTQTKCYPSGTPRVMYRDTPLITEFPGYIVMQFEWGHQFRIIYTDGRPRISNDIKLWYGFSTGHWEGKTLVVETTNLNGYAWLDLVGNFYSDEAKLVERFTPVDQNTMSWSVTVSDPAVLTKSWTMGWDYKRTGRNAGTPANTEIWEFGCNEGNRAPIWMDIYQRELAHK